MKKILNLTAILLASSAMLWTHSLKAADLVKYSAQPGQSSVRIEGTSTIHDWSMESALIGGMFELDSAVRFDSAEGKVSGIQDGAIGAKAQVIIPIRSLKSGKPSMDEVMQDAMNEKTHPRIVYKLKKLKLSEGTPQPNTPFACQAVGDLTINGETKEVTFPVTITALDDSKLKIAGTTPLKMTTFKVTPPRPKIALGLIRTGDEITVSFEWIVAKKI